VQDSWEFDMEPQLLAAAGFAVLRVNFRGSSGYGYAFERAGARQWGAAMQDDLTDATRWAIEQGIADPARICIYGASYGAYAAMMGAVREPDLYRCAAGYVGVYDLMTRQRALSTDAGSLRTFSDQWIGSDRGMLASASPNRQAGRIKVPVLLAAGGEDEITPVEHTRMMEEALKREGAQVDALYFRTEGHGFYSPVNVQAYYGRLIEFLGQHLGTTPQ
jgi:dipeptidyl aminopeptidase/acylaminoacyl peptidase